MTDDKTLSDTPDAVFRFSLSADGMKLGVNRYFPPNGGKGPSVGLIKAQVAAAGVQFPVDEDAAQRVVDAIEEGREFTGIALVHGIPAKEPRDASLTALGDLEYPVFPNDQFARFRPAQKAENGQTINGKEIKPKGNFVPEELTVEVGDNVTWDAVSESYVSTVWGIARLKDDVICVDQIPYITEDEVSVRGNLHHKDFRGTPITPARVDKEMRDMGVLIDMDMDLMDAKLKQAKELDIPLLDQVFVEGAHPVPGRDGWLEYLVATREDAGIEDDSGRLDFRNRGAYPMVEIDQIIGRLHLPTPGEGGIDIYGKTIPAHGGKDLVIHLGENVTLLDDKITYQSKAKGVVVMDRGVLSVTDCLIIHGNVDLESGNVKVEEGSVKVKGSIQAGFSVSAPKHVIVEGSIESATVHAGGLVEVAGGILMPEGGQVTCGGDVIANFATNANIKADGDVFIANEVQNSIIQTKGRLYASSGKGIIIGGGIITGKGLEANELGSELGVATRVGVLINDEEDEKLHLERAKVVKAIKKVDDALGTEPPEVILMRTPEAKKAAVAEVLKHRSTLLQRRKVLSEQINQLNLTRQKELEGVTISAKRFLHPGISVRFGKKVFEIQKRMEASVLYWDPTNRKIAIK
ncbi:FapA family protein [Pseudodesulfovibrio sediminis]|uniref:Cyclic nucleotide-binding domain-containing protein n=1 Tax=Pseudodesulfovibrio sediminis TaxID=2810563 RepID=A0ABN6ESX0_9BACT|nr:FapA family protein [Pseudodesulfovibrio sediminis]BCS88582.1 hypothetical protein PSDVSF_18240 [Pseudodesulfovibrio sediminis]